MPAVCSDDQQAPVVGNADLSFADLRGANLSRANLTGAQLVKKMFGEVESHVLRIILGRPGKTFPDLQIQACDTWPAPSRLLHKREHKPLYVVKESR